jgi:hypothetical protein
MAATEDSFCMCISISDIRLNDCNELFICLNQNNEKSYIPVHEYPIQIRKDITAADVEMFGGSMTVKKL